MTRLFVSEMAALSGLSVRTLHDYDQIGLLCPAEISIESGYRWYEENEARRLQQILFYRELGKAVQTAVQEWQAFLTKFCYPCSNEILAEVIDSSDRRFQKKLDLLGEKTAAFMSPAIAAYFRK